MGHVKDIFVRNVKRLLSPAFIVMLVLSFTLWYISKLSYTYTTELPVTVNLGDNRFKVTCVVEGTGHKLFAHRYYMSKQIGLKIGDVELTQSATNPEYCVINPYSLQNAISVKYSDIKVISIGNVPEIKLHD